MNHSPSSSSQTNHWDKLNQTIVSCHLCPRLVQWREEVARKKRRAFREWAYWGKPVTGFGDREARVLIVGLAPGAHGANRTGRVFTGDSSGDFLFAALHRAGFANQPTSVHANDGLQLSDVYVSMVCHCAPPKNRPKREELENCLPYLTQEIDLLDNLQIIVALGRIAFDGVTRIFRRQNPEMPRLTFRHAGVHYLGDDHPWLITSYHPSRQNTQTGRLTVEMFDQVWEKVREILSA